VAVSSSTHHCLALRDDGSIVAWGDNTYGQCNVPEPNEGYVAIAAAGQVMVDYSYSLAINSEGSVIAWGFNGSGQLDVPPPNTGFVAISASAYHAVGVKADGSAVTWGGCQPNCDPPLGESDIIGVATPSPHSVRTIYILDDSILGWGGPGQGEGLVAAAMGDQHAIAIRGRPSAAVELSPTISASTVSVFPNPFSLRTAVSGPASDLTIYDPTGRLVRALGQTMEWDGYDERGQRVPPGVYFLRMNSPEGQLTLRVTRLR
jgi:alpha-tubulin suppressor-like RCC1 family protein